MANPGGLRRHGSGELGGAQLMCKQSKAAFDGFSAGQGRVLAAYKPARAVLVWAVWGP
ncbi:hypothetical protein GCM10010360_22950 [Streptomyces nogalater]